MAKRRPVNLKIALIGDSAVGKTSLARVFAEGRNSFPQVYITTNEKEIYVKRFTVGQVEVNLKIWDLSGDVNFRTITTYHYKNADGVMLCYSVGNEKSWRNIDNWYENCLLYLGEEFEDLPKSLIGTRIDLKSHLIKEEQGLERSILLPNTDFCLTSAKHNIGVKEAFENLIIRILQKHKEGADALHMNGDAKENSSSTQPPRKKSCTIL